MDHSGCFSSVGTNVTLAQLFAYLPNTSTSVSCNQCYLHGPFVPISEEQHALNATRWLNLTSLAISNNPLSPNGNTSLDRALELLFLNAPALRTVVLQSNALVGPIAHILGNNLKTIDLYANKITSDTTQAHTTRVSHQHHAYSSATLVLRFSI